MRVSTRRVVALFFVLVSACGDTTDVRVRFDAQPGVASRARALALRVWGEDAMVFDGAVTAGAFPVTQPLVPLGDDATRRWRIDATVLGDADATIATERVMGGYVAGESLEVRVLFDDACAMHPGCGARETCRDGACVEACVVPHEPGAFDRTPPSPCPFEGAIALGAAHTCAVERAGVLSCWGSNDRGQLGALGAGPGLASPVVVAEGASFVAIATGASHTCAIGVGGELSCWGANEAGQLGLGDVADRSEPATVSVSGPWTRVAAGGSQTCAIHTDGTLWCWGLFDASVAESAPRVMGAGAWTRVAVGAAHACAVHANGTLWCWGRNESLQLGVGADTASRADPEQVGVATVWRSVAAGGAHTCAIQADGSLWCWGSNARGQVGLGAGDAGSNEPVPIRVSSPLAWQDVACGGGHTCAIAADGTLWCWGDGPRGQLGHPNVNPSGYQSDPAEGVLEGTGSTLGVACGEAHTCALSIAGALSCWGANDAGELGVGDAADRSAPATVVLP